MTVFQKRLRVKLYETLFRIRTAEEAIREHYGEDEMKTPMHMSIGEEGIVAGVVTALGKDAKVLGSYRSHALYLAKTGETRAFFAELYGKATGVARGKAGSMHLSSPEHGHLGASAVVGSTIPLGLGVAYAELKKPRPVMTAVFFGDGAVDEGVFWESLNIGSLWNLPLLYICEDNSLAIHVGAKERHSYKDLGAIVKKFGWNTFYSESTDAEEIYTLTEKAMKSWEKNKQPAFLHLKYYRYLEHVGVNEDFDAGYRSRKEFEVWLKKDPIDLMRKKLLASGIRESYIQNLEERIKDDIEKSLLAAKKAPLPKRETLFADVYA